MAGTTTLWVLRHGESLANVEGRIVSAPGPRALREVGLSPLGRVQAGDAARAARTAGLGPDTVILSSDFARARETAQVLAAELGAQTPVIEQRLRERHFGVYDDGPVSSYDLVWEQDRGRGEQAQGVETVPQVAHRVGEVLAEVDERSDTAPVVLVAHGDVLQIALAIGEGADPHDHREVPHLPTAGLRRLGPGRAVGTPPR